MEKIMVDFITFVCTLDELCKIMKAHTFCHHFNSLVVLNVEFFFFASTAIASFPSSLNILAHMCDEE